MSRTYSGCLLYSVSCLLFISLACNYHLLSKGIYTAPQYEVYDTISPEIYTNNEEEYTNIKPVLNEEEYDEADMIIRRSYEKSYAHIQPCNESERGKECMRKTLDYINQINTTQSFPWWFQTLIRDVIDNGSYGFWHHFTTTNPSINFCTIGKVATTEWRRVFCELNRDDCMPNPLEQCGKKQCAWKTKKNMTENAPWTVFLRDPLERLLSGFLDKCYRKAQRKREKHCAPNVVFNSQNLIEGKKKNGEDNFYPNLIQDIDDKDKQFFSAYIEVLPLKWNIHFIPQAIACDLHRDIGNFDFVGKMGTDFAFELDRMARQFGGQLPEVLNKSFAYKEHIEAGLVNNTGKEKNRHATHAPAKVQQFYTAATVRRGLELLSLDYITLGPYGLQVPEWARQMLRDDVS